MAYTHDKARYVDNNPYKAYAENSLSDKKPAEIEVNHTIKPVDRELATAEIERGEIVFKPTGELYRALGNKHSKGKNSGTPVNLPENSFIFSDYKPLALKKEDKELFKFKVGGKLKDNTPAKVLKKEVDLEHHNRMIAITSSQKHDAVSKKSAELQLGKNFKKVGQVAYLQEEYKGFPNGLPDFSQGTVPVENTELEAMQQQYQSGGFTRLQLGGKVWPGDKYGSRRAGTPTSNGTRYSQNMWDTWAKELGYQGDIKGFQQFLHKDPRFTKLIDDLHVEHRPGPNEGMFDNKLGYRWDTIYKAGNPIETVRPDRSTPKLPNLGNLPAPRPLIIPQEETEDDILPYEPNVGLSPLQKFSLANSAYNAASVVRNDPKRSQMSFTPLNLEKVNAQPYMNAINNQTQQAYKANQVMNPVIARANNSNIYGRGLEQVSDIQGKIDNQNIQISNQENMYNNRGINETAARNVGLDGQYFDRVTASRDNYKTEKDFLRNRLVDEYKGYRTDNNDLELKLASQPTFGTRDVYQDPKSGKISLSPKEGWIKRRQAAPLYDYNNQTNNVYFTGAGMNIDQLPTNNQDIVFQQLRKKIASGAYTDAEMKSYALLASRMARK